MLQLPAVQPPHFEPEEEASADASPPDDRKAKVDICLARSLLPQWGQDGLSPPITRISNFSLQALHLKSYKGMAVIVLVEVIHRIIARAKPYNNNHFCLFMQNEDGSGAGSGLLRGYRFCLPLELIQECGAEQRYHQFVVAG